MTDRELSDAALDHDVARALAVDPSPAFVAGIRQRIAEEPGTREGLSAWRVALAAAGIAAAGVAVALVGLNQGPRRPDAVPALTAHALPLDTIALTLGSSGRLRVNDRPATARGKSGRHVNDAEVVVDPREAR